MDDFRFNYNKLIVLKQLEVQSPVPFMSVCLELLAREVKQNTTNTLKQSTINFATSIHCCCPVFNCLVSELKLNNQNNYK